MSSPLGQNPVTRMQLGSNPREGPMKYFVYIFVILFWLVFAMDIFDANTGKFPRKKIWNVSYSNGFCIVRTDYIPSDTCELIHETEHAKFYNLGICKPCYDIFDRPDTSFYRKIGCDVRLDKDVIYYLHSSKEEEGKETMVLTFLLLWPDS